MDTSILEDIGLTGAEIKVFVTLLELGSSSAGRVVEKSGLQNAVVHRAFHSLAEKGLITYVLKGKIKQYQSIEPRLLLNFIDEKKEALEKIIPELESKRNESEGKPKAMIFEGIRGVKELLHSLIDTKDQLYFAYGGPHKANEIFGEHFWEGFHNKRIKNKIDAKLIFHQSLGYWAETLNELPLTQVRLTEKDFEELTETIVCGNKVGIIVYLDKPFGFLIEEKIAAKSYKKFFDILWKIAKK